MILIVSFPSTSESSVTVKLFNACVAPDGIVIVLLVKLWSDDVAVPGVTVNGT